MIIKNQGGSYFRSIALSPMSIAASQKWVEELRTGSRAQAKNYLRTGDADHIISEHSDNEPVTGYCCLGVATDVFMPAYWELRAYSEIDDEEVLPPELQPLLGITRNGDFCQRGPGRAWEALSLTRLNDDGQGFDAIADTIEAMYDVENSDVVPVLQCKNLTHDLAVGSTDGVNLCQDPVLAIICLRRSGYESRVAYSMGTGEKWAYGPSLGVDLPDYSPNYHTAISDALARNPNSASLSMPDWGAVYGFDYSSGWIRPEPMDRVTKVLTVDGWA